MELESSHSSNPTIMPSPQIIQPMNITFYTLTIYTITTAFTTIKLQIKTSIKRINVLIITNIYILNYQSITEYFKVQDSKIRRNNRYMVKLYLY
ncbi:unnamed protein product [Paramecium primaurelia]|uniref:Transmembrane protein n=1 Tax=Paramecium primaurelia TaxID=5886 RepID=A0A8S1K3T0_PARPR|nr:unnamed protein product [Paramecium primaurelia]